MAVVEVMGWFPVIEYLVAVLDRAVEGGDNMGREKDGESNDRTELDGSVCLS
jgi:hypothetical protein